jgi:two-component system, NarL family, response regulator YdfI
MRVVVVGAAVDRARVRAGLNGVDVVAEFATLDAARRSNIHADAIVLAEELSFDDRWDEDDTVQEPLTPREIQVLELLAEGLPNKAIAERLRISDQTVKFHVSSISGKLGAANRTDAVRRALRRGLITL